MQTVSVTKESWQKASGPYTHDKYDYPVLQDWYVRRSQHRHRGVTPDEFASSVMAFVFSAVLSPSSRAREQEQEKVGSRRPRPLRA